MRSICRSIGFTSEVVSLSLLLLPILSFSLSSSYFATCIPGLSQTLAQELSCLEGSDATEITLRGNSGVSFTSSPETALRSLLWTRTSHRLMELVATNENTRDSVETRDDLYAFLRSSVDVNSLLKRDGKMLTLSCKCISSGTGEDLRHSHHTALTVKNALVDQCREEWDETRPDVNLADADVPLMLVLHGGTATLYRVLNGNVSLHKRGYRSSDGEGIIHKAALKESLAAGLLLEAGWDKLIHAARHVDGEPAVLVDPMMGSATFLTEAALMASDTAPGLIRQVLLHGKGYLPPAVRWQGADLKVWEGLIRDAILRRKEGTKWLKENSDKIVIQGNDWNDGAFGLAQNSIKQLKMGDVIQIKRGNCIQWKPHRVTSGRTIVVSNPPWGKRLDENVEGSWEALKHFLSPDKTRRSKLKVMAKNLFSRSREGRCRQDRGPEGSDWHSPPSSPPNESRDEAPATNGDSVRSFETGGVGQDIPICECLSERVEGPVILMPSLINCRAFSISDSPSTKSIRASVYQPPAAQTKPLTENPLGILTQSADVLRVASNHGIDVVVFPELFLTGGAIESEMASALDRESSELNIIGNICAELNVACVIGYAERRHASEWSMTADPKKSEDSADNLKKEEDGVYNSIAAFNADGTRAGNYRGTSRLRASFMRGEPLVEIMPILLQVPAVEEAESGRWVKIGMMLALPTL